MIEAIDELRQVPHRPEQILLSTWFGEVEQYDGLRDALDRRGVETVEASEPLPYRSRPETYIHRGHVFHQKFALLNALDLCGDDDWIVKSRPDLKYHTWPDLSAMLDSKPVEVLPALRPHVVNQTRVRTFDLNLASPFWLHDMNFAGLARSLRPMTAFDASYDINKHSNTAIPEIRFFHALVAGAFPVLERGLRIPFNFGMFYTHGEREAYLRIVLADPFFNKVMFAYHAVASALFDFGGRYGSLSEQFDRISTACIDIHRSVWDGAQLRDLIEQHRSRPQEDVFTEIASHDFATESEWSALSDKLQDLSAGPAPRVVYRKPPSTGESPSPPPYDFPAADLRLAELGTAPDTLEGYLKPILDLAAFGVFRPEKLIFDERYNLVCSLRLADGNTIFESALRRFPLELRSHWRFENEVRQKNPATAPLTHSIVSEWVAMLEIQAPRRSGPAELVISLASPNLDRVWREWCYTIEIQAP